MSALPTTNDQEKRNSVSNQTILLVDDDPASIKVLARILSTAGQVRFATNGVDALRVARESAPDLILLDAQMPGMSGFEVCKALKADEALAHVPVIFVTSHSGAEFEVNGFEIGAADFIAKPVNAQLVLARVKAQLRIKVMADEMRQLSMVDSLTGIANRRHLVDALAREWRRARRRGDALAFLMVDVDHFKLFNDRYGHQQGDVCLRTVAQALTVATQRPADLVARYGGEEFALLLPQTARAGAGHVARQILATVEALGIAHEASPTVAHLTVSIGVGCYDSESAAWSVRSADSRFENDLGCAAVDVLGAADKALYAAKKAGRAQAWLLDVADADAPAMAREITATPAGDGLRLVGTS
jgi:diguanylate cyclase (GGDEF)-like protein